jgi:hypothetical protein
MKSLSLLEWLAIAAVFATACAAALIHTFA